MNKHKTREFMIDISTKKDKMKFTEGKEKGPEKEKRKKKTFLT